MKAIRCTEFGLPEKLVLEEIPQPIAGSNQVLIQVEACGVNFPDLLLIQNKYQFKPDLPFSPGGEVVGKIVALGAAVEGFQLGQRVLALCGWGGFAEQVAVDSGRVFQVPFALDSAQIAAMIYTYSTSLHALKDRAELRPGETLLVLGASGGVGLAAVELGKILGAKVIAAASSEEKLALCRAKGADFTINYEAEDLKARIKELTDGQGVDVILDPVGGNFTETALRGIAWKGRYLVVGFAAGDIPKIPMNLPLLKGCSVIGVFWGHFSRIEPRRNQENVQLLLNWMEEGDITKPIFKRYSLKETSLALQAILDRKAVGKGVVVI